VTKQRGRERQRERERREDGWMKTEREERMDDKREREKGG
jgi:hypothetical protein